MKSSRPFKTIGHNHPSAVRIATMKVQRYWPCRHEELGMRGYEWRCLSCRMMFSSCEEARAHAQSTLADHESAWDTIYSAMVPRRPGIGAVVAMVAAAQMRHERVNGADLWVDFLGKITYLALSKHWPRSVSDPEYARLLMTGERLVRAIEEMESDQCGRAPQREMR